MAVETHSHLIVVMVFILHIPRGYFHWEAPRRQCMWIACHHLLGVRNRRTHRWWDSASWGRTEVSAGDTFLKAWRISVVVQNSTQITFHENLPHDTLFPVPKARLACTVSVPHRTLHLPIPETWNVSDFKPRSSFGLWAHLCFTHLAIFRVPAQKMVVVNEYISVWYIINIALPNNVGNVDYETVIVAEPDALWHLEEKTDAFLGRSLVLNEIRTIAYIE